MKILKHGIVWITGERQPTCPECESVYVEYDITNERNWKAREYIWKASFKCLKCKCIWFIEKTEAWKPAENLP